MLIILMVIGVFSIAVAIACFVGADSWAELADDPDVDSDIFIAAGAGLITFGVLLIVLSSLFLFLKQKHKKDM